MENKNILKIVILSIFLLVIPCISANENYTLVSDAFYNFSTIFNSEPVYNNGSTIIGNINNSIDEVMLFNRGLSATEIWNIYNSNYSRFYPVGEMNFTTNNFGTNNTVNITIPNCQQYNGSLINFKVNDGSYSQLNSSCMFDNYNMTGDLTSASVVLQLNSTPYSFYSPVVLGNITLNSWLVSQAPADSCTYTSGDWNILFSDYCNITSNVVASAGVNNITITGIGIFTTIANITGFKNVRFSGTAGQSTVRCLNAGCFK